MPLTTLYVAAVCFTDPDGHVVAVRKRGTGAFMLPGGKLEPGEEPLDAAVREVAEEIGLTVPAGTLAPLGAWTAPAANEADTEVCATVYTAALPGTPAADGEIAELLRIDPAAPPAGVRLAPLLAERVLPAIRQRA
ncbi:NUDIX hydrolase [Nocardiopsis coralliicola]